jgi:hypothetical protein
MLERAEADGLVPILSEPPGGADLRLDEDAALEAAPAS